MSTPIQRGAEALAILWRDENAAGGFGPTDIQTTRAVFASIDVGDISEALFQARRNAPEKMTEGDACDWMADAIIAWLTGGGE